MKMPRLHINHSYSLVIVSAGINKRFNVIDHAGEYGKSLVFSILMISVRDTNIKR